MSEEQIQARVEAIISGDSAPVAQASSRSISDGEASDIISDRINKSVDNKIVNPGAVGDIKDGIKREIAADNEQAEVPLLHKTYEDALDHSEATLEQAEVTIDQDLSDYLGDDVTIGEDGKALFVVDGDEVPLSNLVESYANHQEVLRQESAIKEQKLHVMQGAYQAYDKIDSDINIIESQLDSMKKLAAVQYGNIDWAYLAVNNPQAYEHAVNVIQQKHDHINQVEQMVSDARSEISSEREKVVGQYDKRQTADTVALLQKAVPEWKDPVAMMDGMQELGSFLEDNGFSKDELEQAIYKPKLLMIALDAFAHHKNKESAKGKRQSVRPQYIKTNSSGSVGQGVKRSQSAQINKIRKGGGRVDDVAALIFSRL